VINTKNIEIKTADRAVSADSILIKTDKDYSGFYDTRSAYLLQRLIYSGTGILLPVKTVNSAAEITSGDIVIGQLAMDGSSDLAKSPITSGGYAIQSKNGRVFIAGKGPGTESAVVHFFEKITGSVFVTETEMEPPINDNKTLAVPEYSEIKNPDFKMRFIVGGKRLGYTDLAVSGNGRCLKPDAMYAQVDHSIGGLLPYMVYGEKHPEYYALQKNGERLSPKNASNIMNGLGVHVCMANAEVKKIVLQNMIAWMAANPEGKYYSLTFGDFFDRACQCGDCRALQGDGNLTDRNLRFVDTIASEVKKVYPDKIITTLAYADTASPPTLVKSISDNIRILYCPYCKEIRNCYAFDIPINQKAITELKQWTKLFPGQIYIYDYPSDCPARMRVWPGFYATRDRLQHYAKLGIDGIVFCGLMPDVPGEVAGFNSFHDLSRFVFSKMLWDANVDVDKTMDTFYALYYGPAAKYMKEYLVITHADAINRNLRCDTEETRNELMNAELSKRCFDLFAQAEKAVADTPRYLQRLKKEKLYLLFTTLSDRSLTSRTGIDREIFVKQLAEFIVLMREFKFSAVGLRGVSNTDWFRLISGITLSGTNWLYNPVADAIVADPVLALESGILKQAVITPAETITNKRLSWKIATRDMTGGENWEQATVKCLRTGLNDRTEVIFRRPSKLTDTKECFLTLELLSVISGGVSARAEIALNGKRIFQDPESFHTTNEIWRTVKIPLSENDLLPDANQLTITCLNGLWIQLRNITIVSGMTGAVEPQGQKTVHLWSEDFESGLLDGWQAFSDGDVPGGVLSASDSTASSASKFAIKLEGSGRILKIKKYKPVTVHDRTRLEFDWRSDCEDKIAYLALTIDLQGYDNPLWVWGMKDNKMVLNPIRGTWHHANIPVAGIATADGSRKLMNGDVIKSMGIFQVQVTGKKHSFTVDNLIVTDVMSGIPFSDPGKWTDVKDRDMEKPAAGIGESKIATNAGKEAKPANK